jgi:hypothetical protein
MSSAKAVAEPTAEDAGGSGQQREDRLQPLACGRK